MGLQELLLPFLLGLLGLEPRLNARVLVREVGHVGHQVLDHVHVRQGVELHRVGGGLVDVGEAGQRVGAVDVHGAGPANALAAAVKKKK